MMRRLLSSVAIVTIGLSLLGPATAQAQAVAPVKVAVVKPAKIYSELQETKDNTAKTESEGKTLKAIGDEKGAKIKQLEVQLAELRRDSPSFAAKNKELLAARTEAEVWARLTQQNFEAGELVRSLAVFRKVEAAIAEIAKAKGIDVVLADVSGELPQTLDERATKQAFMQYLNQKAIWYTAGAADLTNDVTAKLDADYKAGGK